MHDALILRNSSLYQKAEQGDILTGPNVNVNHHKIGPYLVGDSIGVRAFFCQGGR